MFRVFIKIPLIVLVLTGFVWTVSARSYIPSAIPRIEEDWRWTELEALSYLDYTFVRQGKDGDLWFAKPGEIARFDGFGLERFEINEEVGPYIQDFYVQEDGSILVIAGKYVIKWNGEGWDRLLDRKKSPGWGGKINTAKDGSLWFTLGAKLYRFKDGLLKKIDSPKCWIISDLIDSEGRLWLMDGSNGRLFVYDIDRADEEGIVQLYCFENKGEKGGTILYLGSDGRVWDFQKNPMNVRRYYENYQAVEVDLEISGHGFLKEGTGVAEVPNGTFWMLESRRLVRYKEREGVVDEFSVEDYPIPTSVVYLHSLDGKHLLVGGAESKVYSIDLSLDRWTCFSDLNFQCEDHEGVYWFISHEGKLVSHRPTDGVWEIHDDQRHLIDMPNKVFCSSDGVIWASGMHEEVAAVSYRENGKWTLESFPDAGRIFSHLGVIETQDGSMLFGSGTPENDLGGHSGGAVIFRRVDDTLKSGHLTPPVFPVRISSVIERKNDDLWFGGNLLTRRLGDRFASETVSEIKTRWIDDLAVDLNNNLWVAMWGGGVLQFDGESWVSHDEDSGLKSRQVICLLEGEVGSQMIAMTREGVSRYDGRSWSNDILPVGNQFKRESHTMARSRNSDLWVNFCYRSWLLEGDQIEAQKRRYRTVRYRRNNYAPRTEISRVDERIFEGSQRVIEWTGADWYSETPIDKLEYSWRLNGGDWSAYSRATSVTLNNIESGAQRFEVRARDLDMNVESKASVLNLEVIPYLWKRPWFIMLVLCLIAAFVFLVNALLKMKVKTALAMEEFKLDFFTNISHELKTPLAVIIGPLERLIRKEQSEDTRHNLRLALRNARKMQGLVDQLLQFRKFELGKALYRPSPGELVGFLRETVKTHAPLWEEKKQILEITTNPHYCHCEYDSDKFQKIVDNLISNAIKYTPCRGLIKVTLDVGEVDGHQEACLFVEDTGVGIPPHEIDLVLKPFYRVNREKHSVEGFGIGLALVCELVRLWGGEISIESEGEDKESGTRVMVRLPLGEVNKADEGIFELEQHAKDLEDPICPRILLVEDNLDLRQFMKDELSESYQVLEADNGKRGLEIAIKDNPDLVVTDVMMPEMDGFDLCRQLRGKSETSHIPIIILTAKSSEEHSVQGIEAGADAYFDKPLNMLRLCARIENLLETRRQLKRRFAEQLVVEPTELTVSSTDEAFLRRSIEIVEANMSDEAFDVDQFAKEMKMSRATLYRKLKALTGQAPNPFIRTMRLKRAAQLLQTGNISVSETLEHIGILDLSYFSRVFKKEFGVAPTNYATTQQTDEPL